MLGLISIIHVFDVLELTIARGWEIRTDCCTNRFVAVGSVVGKAKSMLFELGTVPPFKASGA